MCLACSEEEEASRAHITRCDMLGTKSQEGGDILCTNPLDDILNEDTIIMEGSRTAITEELIQYIIQKFWGITRAPTRRILRRRGHSSGIADRKLTGVRAEALEGVCLSFFPFRQRDGPYHHTEHNRRLSCAHTCGAPSPVTFYLCINNGYL